MPVATELVTQPIKAVFSPLTGFAQLHNAVSRLQPSLSKSSPDEATCAMLSACCSSGHAAWVADYLHEICGDSSLSSVNLEDMAVMNGDCVESWLLRSTGDLINEMSASSALTNSGFVAKLLGQVVCLQAVNDSLKSLRLPHGGVPSDKLNQCHQLLSVLVWMSMHGVNCAAVPDVDNLRQSTEMTQLAVRQADLAENSTLQIIQSVLPLDSSAVIAYPFPGLMQCLQTIFLNDPSGDESSASRSHARVHLLLYYLWGSQITCDWEGLATALGVPADKARGWHAIAMLEHVLGQQLQPARPMGGDATDPTIASAMAELSICQQQDLSLYAAELLVALKQPRLALQQAQRCRHSIVSTLTATQVAVPVLCRLISLFLDLDDALSALEAARSASKNADKSVRDGMLLLFAEWASQATDTKQFLQLPFTIEEEDFFKTRYPDFWTQAKAQSTEGHAFWRSYVGSSPPSAPEPSVPAPVVASAPPSQPGGLSAGTPGPELSFETHNLPSPSTPSSLLFQPGGAAQHKRLRHM